MRCELPPGRRLVIDELARQLQVSSIPVREALQLLQSEGLVTNVPHMGATVSPISQQSIDEVFTLMEGLETVATRRAAERLTPEDGAELEQVVAAMDEALAAGRHDEWADLNTRFHLAISRMAGMPMLLEMTDRVLARWDRVRRFYFNGVLVHRVELAQEEHRKLLRLIREQGPPRPGAHGAPAQPGRAPGLRGLPPGTPRAVIRPAPASCGRPAGPGPGQAVTRSPGRRGSVRMRLPVAAKIALQTAGSNGGSAGSPRPVGGLSVFRKCTSTCGRVGHAEQRVSRGSSPASPGRPRW